MVDLPGSVRSSRYLAGEPQPNMVIQLSVDKSGEEFSTVLIHDLTFQVAS